MSQTAALLSRAPQGTLEKRAEALGLKITSLREFFGLPMDGSGDEAFMVELLDSHTHRKMNVRELARLQMPPV